MNSVESTYRQGTLQINNVITQLQFARHVVILFFLGRFEKTFLLSLISVHCGLRRQTYQKVTMETPDQCSEWSQTFDQKGNGMMLLSPF